MVDSLKELPHRPPSIRESELTRVRDAVRAAFEAQEKCREIIAAEPADSDAFPDRVAECIAIATKALNSLESQDPESVRIFGLAGSNCRNGSCGEFDRAFISYIDAAKWILSQFLAITEAGSDVATTRDAILGLPSAPHPSRVEHQYYHVQQCIDDPSQLPPIHRATYPVSAWRGVEFNFVHDHPSVVGVPDIPPLASLDFAGALEQLQISLGGLLLEVNPELDNDLPNQVERANRIKALSNRFRALAINLPANFAIKRDLEEVSALSIQLLDLDDLKALSRNDSTEANYAALSLIQRFWRQMAETISDCATKLWRRRNQPHIVPNVDIQQKASLDIEILQELLSTLNRNSGTNLHPPFGVNGDSVKQGKPGADETKGLSMAQKTELCLLTLNALHHYGDDDERFEQGPFSNTMISRATEGKLNDVDVTRALQRLFKDGREGRRGGSKEYKALCEKGVIKERLTLLNGDLPSRDAVDPRQLRAHQGSNRRRRSTVGD